MGSRALKVGTEDGNRAASVMPSFVPSVPVLNSMYYPSSPHPFSVSSCLVFST